MSVSDRLSEHACPDVSHRITPPASPTKFIHLQNYTARRNDYEEKPRVNKKRFLLPASLKNLKMMTVKFAGGQWVLWRIPMENIGH